MRRLGLVPALAREQAQKRQTAVQGPIPLPPPTGKPPFRKTSAELDIPAASGGVRRFHALGDSGGIDNPKPQDAVAAAMVADLACQPEFAFAWHVGDIGYYEGEESAFEQQLFEAYARYNRLIIGHPGNHDGEGPEHLASFMRYFCDTEPRLWPEVEEYNRDSVDLPNVYWTLRDELVTIIALYTNVPSGGVVEQPQREWAAAELKEAPTDRPCVVSLHHPPYSVDEMHGGSAEMVEVLDGIISTAGRAPELVTAGHIHDDQYFTREINGKEVGFAVTGNGGYRNRHPLASDAVPGMEAAAGVTFRYGDASEWGYLRMAATPDAISAEYVGVAEDGTVTPGKYSFSIPIAA